MENIKYAIKGGKLLLEIDLNNEVPIGRTRSGNTTVATSDNWARFHEMPGWNFNMVLTRKPGTTIPRDTETAIEMPKAVKTA